MTTATQTIQTANPIEAAVLPLKEDAITRAEQEARGMIDEAIAQLERAGWDLNVVAPRPHGGMKRAEYLHKQAMRSFFESIVKPRETNPTMAMAMGRAPMLVNVWQDGIKRFVANAKEDAAVEYDAFVAKLVQKVGDCDSATLEGNHVWFKSTLTVVKPNGTERWQTKMIINRSCLGKLFNQFPTRKVK